MAMAAAPLTLFSAGVVILFGGKTTRRSFQRKHWRTRKRRTSGDWLKPLEFRTLNKRFGQLQGVDLNQVEPGSEQQQQQASVFSFIQEAEQGVNLRDDVPVTFPKMDAIIEGLPSYDEPYVRVPKVLHKED
ncbi:unnamed protein product [Linum tenue]|uniref:Uncharacterized protein n=1 Tax=Linum tenue TaxID=586396 RepID=A0AAV0I2M9_9ROSI|nr:unnamed protein product [Linum tenue]